MKKEIVRTTFDLPVEIIKDADAIVEEAQLASRKEAIELSVRVARPIVRAMHQGSEVKIAITDSVGETKLVPPQAVIEAKPLERSVYARFNQETVLRLLMISHKPYHPADLVCLRLAMAANHPKGPQFVPASWLFEIIYVALRLNDESFTALVRDVVTTCSTSLDSFAGLLAMEHEMPKFDRSFLEQRFLEDEYTNEKKKEAGQRPAGPAPTPPPDH